mgnify:CR=1 FL=1
MLDTLISIAPLFILIALGRVLFYLKVADANWVQVFNTYTLKLGFPALIFSSIYHSKHAISEYQHIFVINSGYLLLIFLLGLLLLKKTKDKRTYIFCLIFNNIAFLGIPILNRIYGNNSNTETGFIASTYLLLIFTLGVIYLEISRSKKINPAEVIKNLLTTPLLLAILLGMIFHITKIELPLIIDESIELIAISVTPIILLSLGIFTGMISFNKLTDLKPLLTLTILTLVVAPSLLYYLSQFTVLNLQLSIMEAAMPVAVAPFAMADRFSLNKKFIAKIIIISTTCSAFTLTVWHWLMN